MKHPTPNPTRFQEWIRAYGVKALARKMQLDPTSVSKWANGKGQPNLDHATVILQLAKGKLQASDLVMQKGGVK